MNFKQGLQALQLSKEGDLPALQKLAKAATLEELAFAADKHGSIPLHWAAGGGHLNVVKWFLQASDPVSGLVKHGNKTGRNALHWAARNGRCAVVRELLKAGGDPFACSKSGENGLHWCLWGWGSSGGPEKSESKQAEAEKEDQEEDPGDHEAVASLLVSKGLDVDSVNHHNCSCVHWAAANGSYAACQWLLAHKADLSVLNKSGHGAVNKAAWKGNAELVAWLVQDQGLRWQLLYRDDEARTPVDLARMAGHASLADYMQREAESLQAVLDASEATPEVAARFPQPRLACTRCKSACFFTQNKLESHEKECNVGLNQHANAAESFAQ